MPLDDGTLTDRMNMMVIITSARRLDNYNNWYFGYYSKWNAYYCHYAFREISLSIVGK